MSIYRLSPYGVADNVLDMRPCPPPEIDELVRAELQSQTPSEMGTPEDVGALSARVEEKLEALPAESGEQALVENELPPQTVSEIAALETEQQLGMCLAYPAFSKT